MRDSNLKAKVCSRRQRNGHLEPLLPGAAIRLTVAEISSLLQSEKIDDEARVILEEQIKIARGTDKDVELGSLVKQLQGQAISLDSKLTSTNESIKEHLKIIEELKGQLSLLEDQRHKIRQLYNDVHSSSFRIPVIPPEILGEIFIACLPRYPRAVITEAPILLCRICTTWRQIALSTPQLWTFITLARTNDMLKLPQVADRWLSSGGTLPLSLRFDIKGQSDLPWQPNLSSSLLTHTVWSRLSNLELNTTYSHSAQTILRSIRPSLDCSKIERLAVRTDYPLHSGVTGPESFPNLRKMVISYNHPAVSRLDIMPYTRLTHLCISGLWLSAQSWSSIIRQCTDLQHGLFVIATAMDTPHVEGKETTLPNLLTLKIVLHSFGYQRMMNNLHFPSLRSLSIGCVEHPGVWNPKCLSPINTDQLRSLVLYRLNISTKQLLDLLRTTTRLDSLVIDLPIRTSKFFEEITIKQESSDVVLPMLSRLTVFHPPSLGKAANIFEAMAFVNMVKSRWNVGNTTSINRLSMVSVRTKVLDIQTGRARRLLSRLLQEGLLLDICALPHGLRVSTEVSW